MQACQPHDMLDTECYVHMHAIGCRPASPDETQTWYDLLIIGVVYKG